MLTDLRLTLAPGAAPDAIVLSAVVLAAGMSRRMEGRDKLLLDVGGEPMIRRTVRNVLAIAPAETIVVTGHRAAAVEAALAGLAVRHVHNAAHEQGQPTSVAAGVRALSAYCQAVMVVLGDQPLVAPDDLLALVTAYRDAGRGSILVPHHQGRRGNPILFAARHIPAVIGGGLNVGCRHLIEDHADEVARVEFARDVYTLDCDTPDDYARLAARMKAEAK